MPLPAWTPSGLLPPGIHRATLDDIYERCVRDVDQHVEWREALFNALKAYVRVTQRVIPEALAWVDGGFMTAKQAAPFDIDVVIHPADWQAINSLNVQEQGALLGALTLQDAIIGSPDVSYAPRIQPVSGALDSFLCYPGEEDYWTRWWSSVRTDDGMIINGATKGFAEVSW